ncbi:MAG: hypothetical protein HY319_27420 [Armatimonadetes bacterium]|nr:hypothetical protein [Armatimonadota bacterium]
MRVVLFGLILFSCLVPTLSAQEQPSIFPGRRIGPMALRSPASAVTTRWGAARQRPAKQGNDYRWWEYPEREAWMLVYRGRVIRAGVEGGEYITPEGFGVGTKARHIVQDYGGGSKRRAVPWHEKKDQERRDDLEFEPHRPPERYFLDYPNRGVSFLVDTALDRVLAIHIFVPGTDPAGPGAKPKQSQD